MFNTRRKSKSLEIKLSHTDRANDIRGVNQLAVDAVTGLTDIVEALHYTILSLGLNDKDTPTKTRGVTGFVYRNIRSITAFVGDKVDLSLSQFGSALGQHESSLKREVAISMLNGVLGDYLLERQNPLAVIMQLRRDGVALTDVALRNVIEKSDGKILLMVHGLCMNDLQWQVDEHDHGIELARDLGYEPIYLHYNTGRHISENGRDLAALLEYLMTISPQPLTLSILAHSMGGLVSRSAFHYGEKAGHTWLQQVHKMVFLGTPHHGAALEKGGNMIDILLGSNPFSLPFAKLGQIRSAGITDLRYGSIIDEHWQGKDRFSYNADDRGSLALPNGVHCYTVAAVKSKQSTVVGDGLIGDGLVNVDSALGRHNDDLLHLTFPEQHQWVGRDMNHMDLLYHPDVYSKIRHWLLDK
ncbi:esterase/lipase family protein [Moritella marina]|uniref:esterase/lipase family protein n=1 Tax=Moritella marina TaxID=90736 RepID=UPI0037049B7A